MFSVLEVPLKESKLTRTPFVEENGRTQGPSRFPHNHDCFRGMTTHPTADVQGGSCLAWQTLPRAPRLGAAQRDARHLNKKTRRGTSTEAKAGPQIRCGSENEGPMIAYESHFCRHLWKHMGFHRADDCLPSSSSMKHALRKAPAFHK